MATLKSFTIAAALFVATTSLAVAQNGLPTGGEPPVGGGASGNPANMGPPGPGLIPHDVTGGAAAGTRVAPTTRRHRGMYMSAPSSRHKSLETGQPTPKQPHAQNGGY
jgi:hypothetical protein